MLRSYSTNHQDLLRNPRGSEAVFQYEDDADCSASNVVDNDIQGDSCKHPIDKNPIADISTCHQIKKKKKKKLRLHQEHQKALHSRTYKLIKMYTWPRMNTVAQTKARRLMQSKSLNWCINILQV